MPKKFDISRLPFDLPPNVYYTVLISPHVAGLMATGSDNEIVAISEITNVWEKHRADRPEFGIHIQRRYGLSPSEDKQIADNTAAIRLNTSESMNLYASISAKTGIPFEQVQLDVNRIRTEGVTVAYLVDFVDDFLKIKDFNGDAEELRRKTHTVLVKRAIPSWTEDLTEALHSDIRKSLDAFLELEYEGLPVPKK